MAAVRREMLCRILFILLLTLLWIGLWYSSTLPGPAQSSRSAALRKNHQVSSLSSNGSSFSEFWEVEDRQLTDDLIGEVVDELEKIRQGISQAGTPQKSGSESCKPEKAGNDPSQKKLSTKSFQIIGQSLHSLVISSVSRLSLEEFSAVALASVQLRRHYYAPRLHSCAWVTKVSSSASAASKAASNDSSVIWGPVQVRFVNDSQTATNYDVAVISCSFGQPVGASGEGGFLVLNLTTAFDEGKSGFVTIFEEKAEEISSIQFEGPFRFDFAYCSPPVFNNLSKKYVSEWLKYHQALWGGKIHYLIYVAGGIDPDLRGVFQPLVNKGLLTIVELEELRLFGSSGQGFHQLMINDCLQKTRFMASWAFSWEFDEYLQMVNSSLESMRDLLQIHEKAPWISLGNLIFSRTYCKEVEEEGALAVERMCFRLQFLTCGDENRANTCHGVEGRRKWIANPRKVLMATIHRTLEPEWNGVILDAATARLNRFHELSAAGTEGKNCWITKRADEVDEKSPVDGWWWKDDGLSAVAARARSSKKWF